MCNNKKFQKMNEEELLKEALILFKSNRFNEALEIYNKITSPLNYETTLKIR